MAKKIMTKRRGEMKTKWHKGPLGHTAYSPTKGNRARVHYSAPSKQYRVRVSGKQLHSEFHPTLSKAKKAAEKFL